MFSPVQVFPVYLRALRGKALRFPPPCPIAAFIHPSFKFTSLSYFGNHQSKRLESNFIALGQRLRRDHGLERSPAEPVLGKIEAGFLRRVRHIQRHQHSFSLVAAQVRH